MCEHVCRHVYLSTCVYHSSLSGRLASSGQLQSSICWACIHRAFCIFANLLGLLTFFRLLLSWHFLCEDFSDLLKHSITVLAAQGHLFICFSPCCMSLAQSNVWQIIALGEYLLNGVINFNQITSPIESTCLASRGT